MSATETHNREEGHNMQTITVTEAEFNNMPDWVGMTLRQTLKALRQVDFGSIGWATVELSDGTTLDVVLKSSSENTRPMSSQYVWRHYWDGDREITVRNYAL